MTFRVSGVFAPVLTPFTKNLEPDEARFIAHCQWLVEQNVGLAIFGTNSEAASLSVGERIRLTDVLLSAGIRGESLMPGTGACSLADAVTLTRHAVQCGASSVLILPPFYFKGVSEDGLFAYYSEIIERVGDDRLAVFLYHIPQLTQAPITLSLIERLLKRYPRQIAGAKDSSGDWTNSLSMISAFASSGFAVFPASESLLSKTLAEGGAGCISATVNVNPADIHSLFKGWSGADGKLLQEAADAVRSVFQATSMIPAMKYTIAQRTGHEDWATVRPPLVAFDGATGRDFMGKLQKIRFELRNYPHVAAGSRTGSSRDRKLVDVMG